MNRRELFVWLVCAGLSAQITTSAKAIDCMTIALSVPIEKLGDKDNFALPMYTLVTMAKELIGWRFNGKRRPRWIKLPDDSPLLEGVK